MSFKVLSAEISHEPNTFNIYPKGLQGDTGPHRAIIDTLANGIWNRRHDALNT